MNAADVPMSATPFADQPLQQALVSWTARLNSVLPFICTDVLGLIANYVFPHDTNEAELSRTRWHRQSSKICFRRGTSFDFNCWALVQRGVPEAMLEWAILLMEDEHEHGPTDWVEALRWFRRAAEAGNEYARAFVPHWRPFFMLYAQSDPIGAKTAVGVRLRSRPEGPPALGEMNEHRDFPLIAWQMRYSDESEEKHRLDVLSHSAYLEPQFVDAGSVRNSDAAVLRLAERGCPSFQFQVAMSHLGSVTRIPGVSMGPSMDVPDAKVGWTNLVAAARAGLGEAIVELANRTPSEYLPTRDVQEILQWALDTAMHCPSYRAAWARDAFDSALRRLNERLFTWVGPPPPS